MSEDPEAREPPTRVDVVRLWEIPRERILDTEHYALWPLASLMAGATAETILAVAERRELTGLLATLATRRIPYAVVQEVLRRNPMLLDKLAEGSEAVEVWREQGREQGRKAGLEEGRREGARMIVQDALAARFGALPADLTAAPHQADEATLRTLILHLSSESLVQIRQRLGLSSR